MASIVNGKARCELLISNDKTRRRFEGEGGKLLPKRNVKFIDKTREKRKMVLQL